jgi:hypothetical protein
MRRAILPVFASLFFASIVACGQQPGPVVPAGGGTEQMSHRSLSGSRHVVRTIFVGLAKGHKAPVFFKVVDGRVARVAPLIATWTGVDPLSWSGVI